MEPKYDYPAFVAAISKPGADIRASLTDQEAHVIHMLLGIAGEAGELIDAIKKAAIYKKPLDIGNVREELGDIEFYLQGIRNAFGWTREEIELGNYVKLSKRYPKGAYSNQQAIERADKTHADVAAIISNDLDKRLALGNSTGA